MKIEYKNTEWKNGFTRVNAKNMNNIEEVKDLLNFREKFQKIYQNHLRSKEKYALIYQGDISNRYIRGFIWHVKEKSIW